MRAEIGEKGIKIRIFAPFPLFCFYYNTLYKILHFFVVKKRITYKILSETDMAQFGAFTYNKQKTVDTKRIIKYRRKKEKVKTMITKDILVADLVEQYPEVVQPLMGFGMHCIGCIASHGESLGEACMVHGLDADDVVDGLNNYVAKARQ